MKAGVIGTFCDRGHFFDRRERAVCGSKADGAR